MNNNSYVDYSKLHKQDRKLNYKLIFSYYKKYKLKYLMLSEIIGLLFLYMFDRFYLGNNVDMKEFIQISPIFIILILFLFFMFDIIKWGLERFRIFTPREFKICKYAIEYLSKAYNSNEITREQFYRMLNVYNLQNSI